jgi:hypothetical protein
MKTGIFFSFILLAVPTAFADRCPAPDEVRERKISMDYEWTVGERVTLENILLVKRLIAVRVINNGEFVLCRYTTERQLVRMYGLPKSEGCVISISSGEWIGINTGESVCQEKDTTQCLFDIEC